MKTENIYVEIAKTSEKAFDCNILPGIDRHPLILATMRIIIESIGTLFQWKPRFQFHFLDEFLRTKIGLM